MDLPKILGKAGALLSKVGKPLYDLDTLEGINSIPVKSFDYDPRDGKNYAFNKIEYILQRKATEHKKNGRLDLAIACLKKANEIMPLSDMMYTVDDYLRLAKYLRLNKQFDEAHEVEQKYLGEGSQVTNTAIHERAINSQLKSAKDMGTDLIDVVCNCYHCANCSIYGNRVYSINGKDKRFPKLPDYIKNNFSHCFMMIYPFIYGVNYVTNPYTNTTIGGRDVISYSNRPYKDSRPQQWIDGYEHLLEITHQRELDERNSKQAQLEYEQIVIKFPEIAPKSQGGYLRMKKTNSKNFQKIKSIAESAGIVIKAIEGDSNSIFPEQSQQVPSLQSECPDVENVLENILGKNHYKFTHEGNNYIFDCEKFILNVPDYKPNRYVIFAKSPSKVIFIHNLDELKENISRLK